MSASFEDYLEKLRPHLDVSFEKQLSGLLGDGHDEGTSRMLASLKGGKRIRGCLLCLICDALGGSLKAATPRAIAIELIHSASLIHDDFVDQDTLRRSLPATWTLEGARRAVLLGDLIFASAIEMMSALGREDGLVVSGAIAEIARGAFHEPTDPLVLAKAIRNGTFSGSVYERIIRLKTGILFGAACRLGAVAAAAGGESKESLSRYGLRIGETYQIADDLKDVKRHIATGFIHSNELAVLVPALCFFLKGVQPRFVSMLESVQSEIDDEAMEHLRTVEGLMETDIRRRLDLTVSETPSDFTQNGLGSILRRAPEDLIGMFNKTG